jgi:hypothetical protein
MELRENTTVNIKMGPFVDKVDGFTPKTALTVTVKLSKNGGTLAARNSATAIAHDADGYYTVELNATDTNTLGRLRATATDAALYLPVWENYQVIAAAYYDEKYGAAVALTAGSASTATLDAGASAVDNFYIGQLLTLTGGTGAGQTRRVLGYVGSTKVATVDSNWTTNPASGTAFRLIASASGTLTSIERDAVADALLDRANAVETGLTPRSALKLSAASLAGKISGATAGAGTVTVRNAVADSKNRLVVTNDAFNNRTAVTVDLS